MLVLDYLRFLAIFGVIAFHLHDTITYSAPWFSGGYLGVDIFLFLSGYFIEQSLSGIRERRFWPAAGYFFSRRLLRIMIPMLFVTAAVGVFAYSQNIPLWQDVLYSAIFLYNFFLVFHHIPYFQVYSTPHPFIGMWFIALLVQLYVAHFLISRLFQRAALYRLVLAILGLVSLGGTWLLIRQGHTDLAYVLPWHSFPYIGGALLMSLLGRGSGHVRDSAQDVVVLVTVLALVLLMLLAPYRDFVFYSVATVMLTALFAVAAPQAPRLQNRLSPLIGTLGEMSYAFYLWNVPVIAFVHYFFPQNRVFVSICLSLILILLLSLITYHLIELPMQRRLGKAPRHRSNAIVNAPVIATLLLAGWGWYTLAATESDNVRQRQQMQHDALYRDYLLRQVDQLQRQLRQVHHAAQVARQLSKDQWVQWQPTPRPGYLYDGKEVRSNPRFPEKRVLFISDSVLLGWSGYVIHQVPDGILDGKVGRSFVQATPVLEEMLRLPENRDVRDIVVELGSNGYVGWRELVNFIETAGDRQIFLVIPSVPRPWAAEVRQAYIRAKGMYSNVHLIPWDDISRDHYNYFVADQVHLTWDGAQALMRAILESLWEHGYTLPKAMPGTSTPTPVPASATAAESVDVRDRDAAPSRAGSESAVVQASAPLPAGNVRSAHPDNPVAEHPETGTSANARSDSRPDTAATTPAASLP